MNHAHEFLAVRNIHKSFASVQVLKGVSFSMGRGEILGLVGENGAGKSTLMNILGGVFKCDSGEILIEGLPYVPQSPLDAQKNGIAFIHQELNLFSNLTVAENLFIERLPRTGPARTVNFRQMRKIARETLGKLGECIDPNAIVSDLSIGKRQIVEIAKALTKNARIIIFDEPTTSLSNKEKQQLFERIRDLARQQVSVIYISHILDDVFTLCDSIVVLRDGTLVSQDSRADLTRELVIKRMVGREMSSLYPYVEKTVGRPMLQLKGLGQGKVFRNVDLELREGEVVGLFGLMGAGRSDLANAIFGVSPFDRGEVLVDGIAHRQTSPSLCISQGISYITENRREEGLLMVKSVAENLSLASLRRLGGRLGFYLRRREDEMTDQVIREVRIKTFDKSWQKVVNLSGGNQQKVVIGKWMAMSPRIFILDEPTKGIDVGSKYEIYQYISEIASKKGAVLVISSEMEELMGICDRILVMCRGEITGELQRGAFAMDEMLKLAIGGETNEVCRF